LNKGTFSVFATTFGLKMYYLIVIEAKNNRR
jgi:hypothetical protein